MKQIIHKKQLQLLDNQTIYLPIGMEILCVQLQNGHICIWYKFEPMEGHPTYEHSIDIIGTGNMIDDDHEYIGTVQQDGFVWHVFQQVS